MFTVEGSVEVVDIGGSCPSLLWCREDIERLVVSIFTIGVFSGPIVKS